MGGQTALNVGVELWQTGQLQKAGVKVLGTQIDAIVATEDREIFSQKLAEIGESIALSYSANTVDEALVVANKIGYPVLVRAAFALGGLGSGFADNDDELKDLAAKAFSVSDQILIDQDLRGWKELEYEVVRDSSDNCITVCNVSSIDADFQPNLCITHTSGSFEFRWRTLIHLVSTQGIPSSLLRRRH
jgi:carbamoyl-phosphate synthase/aspartate carbamoyltransferase